MKSKSIPKISVVINTYNEEKNIQDAIKSAYGLGDEVIVVDMYSEDNTKNLAKKSKVKFYSHKKVGYVEPARQYAISKASHDWVFVLDADERIPSTLAKTLKDIAKQNKFSYVAVPRKNLIFGKWIKHSRWWPDYNVRFFRKGYVEWSCEIHSIPNTSGKGTDLLAKPENAIIHHNYTSISDYLRRMDRYTTIQARERETEFRWRNLIRRPVSEFISRYFSASGYKDGLHGLALAGLQAFSEFVVELKIWELNKFQPRKPKTVELLHEMRGAQKEFSYWIAHEMFERKKTMLEWFRRKVKI